MSILEVIQRASSVIGLQVPDAVFTSSSRQHVELAQIANKMAREITDGHEWRELSLVHTMTGDGVTEAFALPSDYDRMPVSGDIWTDSLETSLTPIVDRNEWLGLDIQSFDFVINAWIKDGGKINIKPALGVGVQAKYYYQSNLRVQPSSGSNKQRFNADTDTYRLSEDLLELGIIYQWRKQKKLPYADELDDFETLKSRLASSNPGSRVIRIGRPRVSRGIVHSYPTTVRVP